MACRIYSMILFLAIALTSSGVFAQDEDPARWKTSMVLDITTTQTAYSDSWTGGESGSLSWVSNLNGSAEKQLSLSFNLKSRLKLSFGQTLTQDTNKVWTKPRKSTDLIDWENVGRVTKNWFVDPYLAFRLESQFLDASFEAKKRYFTPIKLTESVGIARKLYAEGEKNEIISRLGVAFRQITKNVIIDSLTLETTDSTLTDGGLESVTDVKLSFGESLYYTGKLTLYKALVFSEKDKVAGTEFEDYWKAVDINWENIVTASITKIISVNFYTQVLYDKEVSKKGRFKETLGIGFVFKML
ncbi:MAG: DUF3078 domain-containing protein [candidate division Zixibacteria bacterium]